MRNLIVLRFAALLAILCLKSLMTEVSYFSFFYAFLLCHFAMAFYYSRRRLRAKMAAPLMPSNIAVLLLGAAASWFWIPNIRQYFGLHHIFSETYVAPPVTPSVNFSRCLLAAFVYIKILEPGPTLGFITPQISSVGMTVATALMCISLWLGARKERLSLERALEFLAFEGLGVAAALMFTNAGVTLYDVIFFHLVFWFFYPFCNGKEFPQPAKLKYLLGTFGITAVLFCLTPFVGWRYGFNFKQWDYWAISLGYLHITSSFLLSSANPGWLKQGSPATLRLRQYLNGIQTRILRS